MRNSRALLFSALIVGCGCGNDKGAQDVGRSVGQTVTDFASGVGQGIDTHLEVMVELSPDANELGLQKTVAKQLSLPSKDKGISVYFTAQRAVNVNLTVRALNAEGLEIGRSKVDVEFAADDAKYVPFTFDAQMDSQLVQKYVIDVKEAPPADAASDADSNPEPAPEQSQ